MALAERSPNLKAAGSMHAYGSVHLRKRSKQNDKSSTHDVSASPWARSLAVSVCVHVLVSAGPREEARARARVKERARAKARYAVTLVQSCQVKHGV